MTHTIPKHNAFLRGPDGRIWPRGKPDPHPKAPAYATRTPTSNTDANTVVAPSQQPKVTGRN